MPGSKGDLLEDLVEEGYPGYLCTECGEMFGKPQSFDAHWKPIDSSEPMFADVKWPDDKAKAFELKWPEDNRRCSTKAEIKSLGLKLDHRRVWITAEEEAAFKRLRGS